MAEDLTYPWDRSTQEILLSFRTLVNKAARTLDLPRHGAARAPSLPLVSTVLVVGPVEEEEEGIGFDQRIR